MGRDELARRKRLKGPLPTMLSAAPGGWKSTGPSATRPPSLSESGSCAAFGVSLSDDVSFPKSKFHFLLHGVLNRF